MNRLNIRKLILNISMLLFPITIWYMSPYLIIQGAMEGIVSGSFIVFACMLLASIFFGRIFCGWLCPMGGMQECLFSVNEKVPKQGSVLFGKRVFCHYFCWMAPFMVIGTKIRRFLYLPGLHITVKHENACISCGKCNKICPMGIQVSKMIGEGQVKSMECIQCGACIDACPKKVLSYEMIGKEKGNGNRKKD